MRVRTQTHFPKKNEWELLIIKRFPSRVTQAENLATRVGHVAGASQESKGGTVEHRVGKPSGWSVSYQEMVVSATEC